MRWVWRGAIAAGVVLIAAVIGFVVIAATGSRPLTDGATLADGRVEIVADGFIAIYIVDLADGGVALIDAGMDPSATATVGALNARGLTARDVRAIVFTHGHGDHIGGAAAFPDAALYALEPDVDLVEGRRVAQSPFARNREPELTGLTVDHALVDGDVVSLGGTRMEVFAVPGHTLGSAAYLIHGVLFLGDSAGAARDGTITGAPPVFSADRAQNAVSLRALAERLRPRRDEVTALAFGHQGPLIGVEPLLAWADARP